MNVQHQIDRLIALQAAQWYERLKEEDTAPGNQEFVDWVAESPRHMEAFLAVASEAPMIRRAFADGSFDLAALLRDVAPEVLPLPVHNDDTTTKPAARRRLPAPKSLMLAAAAVAAIAIGAVLYNSVFSWQHFETPIGEQRTIQLAEGSVVTLNTVSRVDVRFSETQRDVRLPSGEATFKVAKDRSRPFRVHTPGAVVEAVGTQFNVYARPDGTTTVSVLEGKVELSGGSNAVAQSTSPVPLEAGEAADVRSGGGITLQEHSDVTEAIAWQQRKLIFKRTSLEDMAAEFNRYNRSMRIRVEGIEAGAFRFTGAFNADDPQSLAGVLMREPELEVQQAPGEIVIRPAAR